MTKGPKHSSKSRQKAVRFALTRRLTRPEVAADFGVGFSTLNRWMQLHRRDPEKPTSQSDLERENAELWKENWLLREGIRLGQAASSAHFL
jgi:transposase